MVQTLDRMLISGTASQKAVAREVVIRPVAFVKKLTGQERIAVCRQLGLKPTRSFAVSETYLHRPGQDYHRDEQPLDRRICCQGKKPRTWAIHFVVRQRHRHGMTADTIARAFDPFFTTKPIGQGTGLGLSMVYGFAGQSGGAVRIYSEIGQGTMICIYLPRHQGDAQADELVHSAEEMLRPEGTQTILLVDDEPLIRMVAAEALEELGYTVIEASDAAAALKVLNSDRSLNLLITDVGLPNGMNGRQLADAGRDVRSGIEVLFITGYAENAVLNHGHLDAGMHVMTKPFQMEAFTRRVGELILKT